MTRALFLTICVTALVAAVAAGVIDSYKCGVIKESHSARGHPWLVTFVKRYKTRPFATGVLISDRYVLTTARVMNKYRQNPWMLTVQLGYPKWDKITDLQVQVESITVHPGYKRKKPINLNNLAVVKLSERIPIENFDDINIACMPTAPPTDGTRCYLPSLSETGSNVYYKAVPLTVLDRSVCQQRLTRTTFGNYFNLHENFICTDDAPGEKLYKKGAPLMCKRQNHWYVAGLVSWRINSSSNNIESDPIVFVNAIKYKFWIEAQIAS